MLSVRGGGGREARWRPSSSTISDRSAVCRAAGRQFVAEPPTVPEERVHGEAALGRTAVGRSTRCWSETTLPGVANDCVGNECLLSLLAQAEPLGGCGDQADAVIGKAHRTPGPAAATVKEPMAEDDAGVVVPENRRPRGGWMRRALGSVTVEPVIFFYMFAFMLTSVVEQAFYVDRACRVNLNLSDTTCTRIHDPEFKGELDRVQVGTLPRASWPQAKTDQRQSDNHVGILFFQVEVSSFHQYNGIASNAVPLVLALFLGSWSDRRGRKLPLLLGLLGQTYYFAMLTVVSTQGEALLTYWRMHANSLGLF